MACLNPLTCIDFYKADHRRQYPEGTELVVSNLTPRSAKHAPSGYRRDRIVFFGLQGFVLSHLIDDWNNGFFARPLDEVVGEYQRRMDAALGEGAIPCEHIAALHSLGYLPIEIRALPEGARIPIGVPCLTIHNTRPEFFWITNYLESVMSALLWLPCTSATTAHNYRTLCDSFAIESGADLEFVKFQCHDFSFRGMSGIEAAMMSGAGHLLSFVGTDTVPAIDYLERYYGADCRTELVGCSVPATEHSVMSMGGELDELSTIRRLITRLYPAGIVSIVSDTWDFWRVIGQHAATLKDEIINRAGKVVFRPDSGDPVKIICGDPDAPDGSPARLGAVRVLWKIFGGIETANGFKRLNAKVGLIYGDSITYERAAAILERMHDLGFSSDNIVFGVGSFTYQHVTRDCWGFAVKATFGRVNGIDRDIYKSPVTDDGMKKSAKGLIVVRPDANWGYVASDQQTWDTFTSGTNELRPVFRNGELLRRTTLAAIRARLSR